MRRVGISTLALGTLLVLVGNACGLSGPPAAADVDESVQTLSITVPPVSATLAPADTTNAAAPDAGAAAATSIVASLPAPGAGSTPTVEQCLIDFAAVSAAVDSFYAREGRLPIDDIELAVGNPAIGSSLLAYHLGDDPDSSAAESWYIVATPQPSGEACVFADDGAVAVEITAAPAAQTPRVTPPTPPADVLAPPVTNPLADMPMPPPADLDRAPGTGGAGVIVLPEGQLG